MTTILEVDTAALSRLAERIRAAAAEASAASADPGPLRGSIGGLGTPCVVHAAGVFVESWRVALADIVDDAHRLADAVDLAARAYQDAESASTRRLGR
jgi:hypothetical protein